ncbi:Helix-hairpin-helix motif protein [Actinomadura rubteroloni]|uniref:Helix-hairpin-helix motif protein n=1 Tax=Actinomadura rubteroloni TaxID=1926885 RepID=A0A2P4US07_9ACTN|nr:helix-hairpin-helix domain-containing protein [Actinomadura rubteroloni]POM27825.1 Helix-hairpin-helix motif protein [Actinomadura rubteroloni]
MYEQRPVRPDLVRDAPPGHLPGPGTRRPSGTRGVHEPDPHGAGEQRPEQYGMPVAPPPPPPVHVHHLPRRSPDPSIHVVHGVLTVATFGLWLPVWIVHTIVMAAQGPRPAPVPVPVRPMMPAGPPVPPPSPEQINHAAVQQAAARAYRRREARGLAMHNPLMARELRIGRTDVPPYRRPYDDGGLIDVNLVPAQELTRFGIATETAERIVAIRDQVGGFSSAEELATIADLPPKLLPELLEYGLYLP